MRRTTMHKGAGASNWSPLKNREHMPENNLSFSIGKRRMTNFAVPIATKNSTKEREDSIQTSESISSTLISEKRGAPKKKEVKIKTSVSSEGLSNSKSSNIFQGEQYNKSL